jgi:hypothetical protein
LRLLLRLLRTALVRRFLLFLVLCLLLWLLCPLILGRMLRLLRVLLLRFGRLRFGLLWPALMFLLPRMVLLFALALLPGIGRSGDGEKQAEDRDAGKSNRFHKVWPHCCG